VSKVPLRFRVSLGHTPASAATATPASEGRTSGPRPTATERRQQWRQPQLTAEQAQRGELLMRRYGLSDEAVRRLVPLDRDYAPSAVLLRDLFCSLLRLAAVRGAPGAPATAGPGRPSAAAIAAASAAAAVAEQPRAAKLQSEENEVGSRWLHVPGLWAPW
jgi:hypothetical protein